MSFDYSACAFFGTFVPRRSEVGETLAKFIEGGAPARVEHGLLIDEVGSYPMGETWVVLRAFFAPRASREDKIEAPRLLEPMPAATRTIEMWLRDHGLDPVGMPPIGWHFAGRCL